MSFIRLFIALCLVVPPTLAATQPLKLSAVEAIVLQGNPDLDVLDRRIATAESGTRRALALEDPTFMYRGWGTPVSQPWNMNQTQHMFMIGQNIPGSGKRELRYLVASKSVDMARLDVESRKRDILLMAQSAFYRLLHADHQQDVHDRQIELARQVIAAARIRYTVGKVPQQDVLKGQIALSQLTSLQVQIHQEAALARIELNALMGRDPSEPIEVAGDYRQFTNLPSLKELQTIALENRPELEALKKALEQGQDKVKLAQKGLSPDFNVAAGYMLMPGGAMNRNAFMAEFSMTLPQLNRGSHESAIVEAAAETATIRSQYQKLVVDIAKEIQTAVIRATNARELAELYRDTIQPQARTTFQSALLAYQTDQVDFSSVLDSQNMSVEAEHAYLTAFTDYQIQLAELERAIGTSLPKGGGPMTPREQTLLLRGIAAGILATIIVAMAFRYVNTVGQPSEPAAAPAITETQPQPGATQTSGIELSVDEQRAIGVQLSEIALETVRRELVVPGRVQEPETGLSTISSRFAGRIVSLLINNVGQTVQKGQEVARLYSTDTVTAAEEYRLAIDNRQRLNASNSAEAIEQADQLIQAGRRRLELLEVTGEQIDSIRGSKDAAIYIPVYATASGTVTTRNVTEGQYVQRGDALLTLTDYHTIWLKADVFEADTAMVHVGQAVEISAEAVPGAPVRGRVMLIEPHIDEPTRTTSVRIEAPNLDLKLRPGMYVKVKLQLAAGGPRLVVPRSAVIDTGTEQFAFVAIGDSQFERRAIRTESAVGDRFPMVSGLKQGERVVTQGAFMIDSQSRLTGGMTGRFESAKTFASGTAPATVAEGQFQVTLQLRPDPPLGGEPLAAAVTVKDASGKSVSDAQVRFSVVMPAMPAMHMPEMRAVAVLAWTGTNYTGKLDLPAAGPWNVTVEVHRNGQLLATHRTRFDAR